MRAVLIQLHKYAGLVLGLLLSVTAMSGSLLVFDRELDELITPATVAFQPATEQASFDLALANAVAAVANGTGPTRLMVGRSATAPHIVRFPTPPGATGPIEVSIDPGSGEVLALRNWGQYPVTWIYNLHLSFLGGERGELLVGVMGLLLLFFCLSGLVIWWPRSGNWRRALSMRFGTSGFRLNYDIHKIAGIYFLPVFLLLAISGIEIVWHGPFERVVDAVLPVIEEPQPQSGIGGEAIGMDEAAATAREVFPQSSIARLYVPASARAPWEVTFMHPGEHWREYGASSVYLDQYSGEILAVWDVRELPAGSKLLAWMFPLHNGDALGLAGRILILVAGLLPPILFGTGVYMWFVKRRQRRRQSRLIALLSD